MIKTQGAAQPKLAKFKLDFPLRKLYLFLMITAFAGLTVILWAPFKKTPPLSPFILETTQGETRIYLASENLWRAPTLKEKLTLLDQIQTSPESGMTLSQENGIQINLGESSSVEFRKPQNFSSLSASNRLHLLKGSLYVSIQDTGERKALQITIPGEKTVMKQGGASIELTVPKLIIEMVSAEALFDFDPETGKTQILVFNGEIKVGDAYPKHFLMLREGQKMIMATSTLPTPNEITELSLEEKYAFKTNANGLKVLHSIQTKKENTAAASSQPEKAEKQKYLSLVDWNAGCEVYRPTRTIQASCQAVSRKYPAGKIFHLDYDLNTAGSFAGLTFWPMLEDISKFEALTIELVTDPLLPPPSRIHIELKSDGNILRIYTLKNFDQEIKSFTIPLQLEKSKPLTQVNVYVRRETLGEYKHGAFAINRLELTAKNDRT